MEDLLGDRRDNGIKHGLFQADTSIAMPQLRSDAPRRRVRTELARDLNVVAYAYDRARIG
jgi:hypothetical protein